MITKFITEVKKRGLARTNSFEMTVSMPGTTRGGDLLVSLFCDAASLPGLNISTTPSRIYGEERQMPYEPTYDPVTLSFYVDADMEVKMAFERWMGTILNPNTREIMYYKDYVRDMKIKVINRDYQPTPQSEYLISRAYEEVASPYEVTLYEAYPKSITAVQLDSNSRDVMKVSVTIQYKYWRSTGKPQLAMKPPISQSDSPMQDSAGINTGQGYPIQLAKDVQLEARTQIDDSGMGP